MPHKWRGGLFHGTEEKVRWEKITTNQNNRRSKTFFFYIYNHGQKKSSLFYAKINTVKIDQNECVIYQNYSEETEFFESEIIFKIRLSEMILSRNEITGQTLVAWKNWYESFWKEKNSIEGPILQ